MPDSCGAYSRRDIRHCSQVHRGAARLIRPLCTGLRRRPSGPQILVGALLNCHTAFEYRNNSAVYLQATAVRERFGSSTRHAGRSTSEYLPMRVAGFDRLRTRGFVCAVSVVHTSRFGTGHIGGCNEKDRRRRNRIARAHRHGSGGGPCQKAPVYKAPPVIVDPWSWTGFYIGLNASATAGGDPTRTSTTSQATGGLPSLPACRLTDVKFDSTARSAAARSAPIGRTAISAHRRRGRHPVVGPEGQRATSVRRGPATAASAGPAFPGLDVHLRA